MKGPQKWKFSAIFCENGDFLAFVSLQTIASGFDPSFEPIETET